MCEYKYKRVCGPFELGEGPHWDEFNQSLYFVDCHAGDFYKLDVETNKFEKVHLGGIVTIIIPWSGEDNNFIVSRTKDLLKLNWSTQEAKLLASVESTISNTRFNDGKCDRKGRLWVGTMCRETSSNTCALDIASLYSMDGNFKVTKHLDKISISNGMLKIYLFDYDIDDGIISNKQTFFDFAKQDSNENEFPDGMTVDAFDKLWVASFNGGRVLRIDPETGKILKDIRFDDVSRITSVCFDGLHLNQLFVTSPYIGLSEERKKQEANAGYLFQVTFEKENIKGLIADRFIGS
ncbi:regucalcin-like protein [Dinothrombium tinctorium]|uniref:Regucalcin-like protein n=1 Tax=Dinothrombium tinctorium TaxID=1965070 RepID=A0A3S3SHK0_9ACAR|nr:regucalcin-like protein [Dinothrombium tinctorium]